MLINKPFALNDDKIKKQNEEVCSSAYTAIRQNQAPQVRLPRDSFIKPFSSTGESFVDKEKN